MWVECIDCGNFGGIDHVDFGFGYINEEKKLTSKNTKGVLGFFVFFEVKKWCKHIILHYTCITSPLA